MAALAAERRLPDLVAVYASLDRLGPPRMAEEADRLDPSPEADVRGTIVAGRQAPALPGGVPGHGGFDEEAIHQGHVGPCVPSRADGVGDGILGQDHFPGLSVEEQLAVPKPAVLAHDLVTALRRGVIERGIGGLTGRIDLGHRTAHPGVPEGSFLVRVA